MKHPENEEKIQAFASILADEYKELLISSCILDNAYVGGEEIFKMAKLDRLAKNALLPDNKNLRRRIRLRAILALYAALGSTALGYLALKAMPIADSFNLQIILLFAITGYIGIVLFVMNLFRSNANMSKFMEEKKSIQYQLLAYEVISKWNRWEKLVSMYDSKKEGTIGQQSISTALKIGIISDNESYLLKKLLYLRNDIAHNSPSKEYLFEAKPILSETDNIISRVASQVQFS